MLSAAESPTNTVHGTSCRGSEVHVSFECSPFRTLMMVVWLLHLDASTGGQFAVLK